MNNIWLSNLCRKYTLLQMFYIVMIKGVISMLCLLVGREYIEDN